MKSIIMYADWITKGQNLMLTLNSAQPNMYISLTQQVCGHVFKPMHFLKSSYSIACILLDLDYCNYMATQQTVMHAA